MREILFRGKRTDNGEWVYGTPILYPDGNVVMCRSFKRNHNVSSKTVGQFTGIYDRNGRRIFEGDIIEHDHPYGVKSVHTVIWNKYGWNLSDFNATYFDDPGEAFSEGTEFMTVIGNIYDNPELLKGGSENG